MFNFAKVCLLEVGHDEREVAGLAQLLHGPGVIDLRDQRLEQRGELHRLLLEIEGDRSVIEVQIAHLGCGVFCVYGVFGSVGTLVSSDYGAWVQFLGWCVRIAIDQNCIFQKWYVFVSDKTLPSKTIT